MVAIMLVAHRVQDPRAYDSWQTAGIAHGLRHEIVLQHDRLAVEDAHAEEQQRCERERRQQCVQRVRDLRPGRRAQMLLIYRVQCS